MSLQDYFTQTLKKDEQVVAIIRKHWICMAVPMSVSLIMIGLLIGFFDLFLGSYWGVTAWCAILFLVLGYLTYKWVIFYFDSFIITDLRIIDIDQTGLFKRTVSETTFDKVEDVTYSIVGIFATGLDYGKVTIQTAAAQTGLELEKVPHPRQVHEVILEAQKIFEKKWGGDMSAKDLIELIAKVKPKDDSKETEIGSNDDNTEE